MADLGISIAEKLIEAVGSAVIKKFCAMWGYKSELEDLGKTVATIKNVLLDAEDKRGDLSNEARGYIEELKAAVYDADDLFDEFRTRAELNQLDSNIKDDKFLKKVRRFFSSKKKGVTHSYTMSRQVMEIKELLNGIVSNHKNFGLSDHDYKPTIRRREETCSYVDAQNIIGREDDKNAVIEKLLGPTATNEDIHFVTIVGEGGLGKTTVAQLVYNDEKVKKRFPDPTFRLWVCVSDQDGQQFEVKAILCKILELISDNNNLENNKSLEWVQREFQKHMKEKKYLLVLDDVWNEDLDRWKDLEKFLRVGERESRVIVTTRSNETARIIGDERTHSLKGLSPQDSWNLFEMTAFGKQDKDRELVEIGEKIVDKCFNNPLAIKVVGSNLYGKGIEKWRSFEASGLCGIENGDNKIMSILMLSYHNLRSSLKSCFSYCALFPKDTVLKKEMLIRLWMAQGYIVPFDRCQSIEDAAEEHFVILLRRCFFQNVAKDAYGNIESVMLHDLMHDVAQEVGGKEITALSSITDHLGDQIRHLYYVGNEHSGNSSSSFKIRSFIHMSGEECPVVIQANNWIRLRVLDLEDLRMKNLPDSIGKMIHLRYLNLSENEFSVLPDSITALYNLQTLILKNCCSLKELPKDLKKLINLRYLELGGCIGLKCTAPNMGKLSNLRVLDRYVVGYRNWSSDGLKELKALTNIRGDMYIEIGKAYKNEEGGGGYLESMTHLTKLNIFMTCENDPETVLEKLEPPPSLKELELWDYRGRRIPFRWGRNYDNWGISLPHLVRIDISNCRELEHLPSLSKLPCLDSLFLEGLEKMEYMENRRRTSETGESTTTTTFFPSLLSLRICEMKNLKGWWREEGLDAADPNYRTSTFPLLSQLIIRSCPNLTSFPLCPLLEDLDLYECNKTLRMRMKEGRDEEKREEDVKSLKVKTDYAGHFKSLSTGCLTTLHVEFYDELESFSEYKELFESCPSSLREFRIRNIFGRSSGGLEHFIALESLKFSHNVQLSFYEDEDEDDGMAWKFLHHNLCTLVFDGLHKLTSLPKWMQYFTSLQDLSLQYCGNLEGLPKWIGCLSSLQSLQIENCPALISLPVTLQNLTSLQSLSIFSCPRLEKRCQKHTGKDWPIIRHIPRIKIGFKQLQ